MREKKIGSGSNRSKIASKDKNTVRRFGNESHFFAPFFFMPANVNWQKLFMIAEIEKRPERMRSPDTKYPFFQGIGETYQRAKRRRYDLGTARQIVACQASCLFLTVNLQ